MSRKIIGSLLIMVSIVCVAVLIIGSLGKDKNVPAISFSEDVSVSYKEGEPKSRLLEDVTAYDQEDGDISDSLVIESVYDFKNGKAKVIYAARDASGNIVKAERIVNYTAAEPAGATQAAIEADPSGGEAGSDEENGPDQENGPNEENDPDEELVPDGEKPALRLTEDKVVVKKGSTFNKLSYVDEIVDDKDDRAQLFRRISIKGDVKMNQPGTYELVYRVTDSDGNLSEDKVLTVEVQE